jgi:hypothetical protein
MGGGNMTKEDLILDSSYTPTYDEISAYLDKPADILWEELNAFIRQEFNVSPRITYSKCSLKPGWNVKYNKSGRAVCTLYPEKESFVVLIVIPVGLVQSLEIVSGELSPVIPDIINSAKPFNNTLWLMIPVDCRAVLNDVKRLLLMKRDFKKFPITLRS